MSAKRGSKFSAQARKSRVNTFEYFYRHSEAKPDKYKNIPASLVDAAIDLDAMFMASTHQISFQRARNMIADKFKRDNGDV